MEADDRVAVIDASVCIALNGVGHVGLLGDLFEALLMTDHVYADVFERSVMDECWQIRELAGFGRVRAPDPLPDLGLDPGETSVIATVLAMRPRQAMALLDEKAARRVARGKGLAVSGTIGIIAEAVRTGIVPAARPIYLGLLEADFYVSTALLNTVLRSLGEDEVEPSAR